LVNLLLQAPMMHGYRNNLWTAARIAELIRHQFGVQYHRDHVGRLMHSLNWSALKQNGAPWRGMSKPSSAGNRRTGRS
jgi:transposase